MSFVPVAAGTLLGNLAEKSPFGGFAPFPNSIMIPFMGAQSAVLGYQFGIHYEMGKRTVKSMPNDLFNNIRSGSDQMINVTYDGKEYEMKYVDYLPFLERKQYEAQITGFRNSLPDYQSLQNDIIHETVKIELKKAERTPSAFVEIINALYNGFQDIPEEGIGFYTKLVLALTIPGNEFPTTDEFNSFLESFVNPNEPEPPAEEPTDPLEVYTSISYSWFHSGLGTTYTETTEALTFYGHKAAWESMPYNLTYEKNKKNAYGNAIQDQYNVTLA